MLDGERPIKPKDILNQLKVDDALGLVVLVKRKPGETDELWMSSLSWDELSWLHAQLGAHITHHIGPMKEMS